MSRGIRIEFLRGQYQAAPEATGGSIRVIARAIEASLMPLEIFLFRNSISNVATGQTRPEYIGVCSPVDLMRFPANEPLIGENDFPAFYRLSEIDIFLPSWEAALVFFDKVSKNSDRLVAALAIADQLSVHSEHVAGSLPESSISVGV